MNGIKESKQPDEEEKMEIDEKDKSCPKTNGVMETNDSSDEIDEEKLLIDDESVDSASVVNEEQLLNSDEETKPLQNGDVDHAKKDVKEESNELKNTAETNDTPDIKKENEIHSNAESKMEVDRNVNVNDANITKTENAIKNENENDKIDKKELLDDSMSIENEEESKKQRIQLQIERVEVCKDELLREEATLSLLHKLLDSQRSKNGYKASKPVAIAPATVKPQSQGTSKPSAPAKAPLVQNKPPPHSNTQPAQKFYIQVGNQLVPAPPPGSSTTYQYNGSASHSYQPPAKREPAPPPAPPKQTPEQKKNAAKAALRRQLEQTLLQIPPPRPPSADWKAIPNVNSMDFMMLVGLDEVVDTILALDKKPTLKSALEELRPFNPRVCSQCKVDFSPCWKAAKNSSLDEFVLCERCSLQNVKKELKAEHTSRLKSAFMKALKQEQEIEEKIKAGEEVDIPNVPGNEKKESSHSPNVSQHRERDRERERERDNRESIRNSSPKLSSQPSARSASHVPSPPERERDRHHQSNGGHHHRHQVVQHYPHHSSLVQQLHHQHIQQQQLELEPSPRHSSHSSRWHPYMPSSSGHHREHHPVHHRSYVPGSSSAEGSPHQEYYVVHHPHHYVAR